MEKGTCVQCGDSAAYNALMCEACLARFDYEAYSGEVDEATYDIEDNKLRIYSGKVAEPLYAALVTAGWGHAYKQGCFYAVWTPEREDMALALCSEILEEESTLLDRAMDKDDRYSGYSANAAKRAQADWDEAERISERFPGGQPIQPVWHHSHDRAVRDQQRMHDLTRRSLDERERSEYWARRAQASVKHAERAFNPKTINNRIATLQADVRKHERRRDKAGTDAYRARCERYIAHDSMRVAYWQAVLAEIAPDIAEAADVEYNVGDWMLMRAYGKMLCAQIKRVNRSRSTGRVSSLSADRATMNEYHYTHKWPPEDILATFDHAPTRDDIATVLRGAEAVV